MYVPSNGRKYTCSSCHAKIAPDTLELVFASELKHFVFSDEDVTQSLAQADANYTAKEARLTALRAEREQVGHGMEKLYRLFQSDQISPEGFGSRNRPLEQRAQQLDNTIPELQAELDFLKIQMLSSAEIISETRELFSRWEGMGLEAKRTIVEAITDRIALNGDEIELELQYVSAFAKDATKGQRTFTAVPCPVHGTQTNSRKPGIRPMQSRSAAPVLFFASAIAFFVAGGFMLRTGNNMGGAYFALGGAFVAIGAALRAKTKKRG
jgi:hypothetical protein